MFIPMPLLIGIAVAILAVMVLLGRAGRRKRDDDRRDGHNEAALQRGRPLEIAPELAAQLRERIARRDKIGAIKLLRDATGMGLKEAKQHVDQL
jgi:ribosomal protein L7/L12